MAVPNKHGGASTTLYFSDQGLLTRVEKLAEACNVSTSRLVESTLEACITELEKKAPTQRQFTASVSVHL